MPEVPLREPQIELWFEFGSNYSYLSVMRIEEAAAARAVRLVWQPFLLGPIFKSFGWDTSPFVLQKDKGDYVWTDMARQCRKYGLPWTRPRSFPRAALLPMRVALLGVDRPWMGAFCRAIMEANFVDDRTIDDPALVTEVLTRLELPAAALLAEATQDSNKLRLREQTRIAAERHIFGAPTFVVRGEMFWGNDRLDDALDFAVEG